NGYPAFWFGPVLLLLLRPLLWVLRLARREAATPEALAERVEQNVPALVYLKKGRMLFRPGRAVGTPFLTALVALQRCLDRPVILLPHLVMWSMGVERYHQNILDLVLGSPSAPGPRRLLALVRNASYARLFSAAPVRLDEVLAGLPPDTTDEDVANHARWLLHQRFLTEHKIARGPVQKGAAQTREELLANPEFQAGLDAVAADAGLTSAAARARASSHLAQIAADMREGAIEAMAAILTPVFNRVFDGIAVDRDLLEAIREAGRETPVVLVPSHRSHMDYLMMSYLLYYSGMVPPHIAAGANLSFFPLGALFRRCGAFFLRRSFREDPVYAHCFAGYVRKLVKEGHTIEFFIEGGRSRTGRVLLPRFGVLTSVVEAVLSGGARDVTIIPVSITYDRIIEAGAYSREITGGEKEAENVGSVIRSAQVLDKRYGTVYVSGGKPLRVLEFLREGWTGDPGALPEEARRRQIKRLGYSVLDGINRAAVVTPSALAALVLLSHLRRGISRTRLSRTLGFLVRFVRERGYTLSLSLDRALKAHAMALAQVREEAHRTGSSDRVDEARGEAVLPVVQDALRALRAERHIRTTEVDGEVIYSVVPDRRVELDYYRNTILHMFLRESFAAFSLLAREYQGAVPPEDVLGDLRFLSGLLKGEFIYRVGALEDEARAAISGLAAEGAVDRETDGLRIRPGGEARLLLFRNMLLPVVESYAVCADHLGLLRRRGPLGSKELVRRLLENARREYHEGTITCQEAVSQVNLANAVRAFRERGILAEIGDGHDRGKLRVASESSERELEALRERLRFLLRGTGLSPR
ncbi:MAG: 1-acyl-sn-glycerol-3-phosphate acyltransferase, partial [Deltaproteobacteria bacterium]|nr:1-acyl-sn-glycerol-3-phosphate acyltransferase [Deltaproteobacteria bacterium]